MSFINFKESIEIFFTKLQKTIKDSDDLLKLCKQNAILKEGCKIDFTKEILNDPEKHLEKIRRKKMKCVFFGQTSNGKSCLVNAILGHEVLPSSDGRTTSCFITIDGCEEDPYFKVNGKRENDISKLIQKANEICDNHMDIKSYIELYWPIYECKLLGEMVQLLDSPGVDFSKDNDKWIETYCMDSDIFVYVVNGQATINESERVFFRKVTSFIKNPNIFVAINKWDLCDTAKNKSQIDRIQKQHYDTAHEFLCKDLKLQCNSKSKTFFLSAKERLEYHEARNLSDEKMIARMREFDRFKETLFDEMSKNAIINKFNPHLDKAEEYIRDVNDVLNQFREVTRRDMPQDSKERHQLIREIKDLITNIFDKINSEGECEIKSQCPHFASAIIGSDGREFGIKEFLHTKIVDRLQMIFVANIKKLRSKMEELFSSCSEFKISSVALNEYLPPSFDEHVTGLQNVLKTNINKGDSEVQNHYYDKSKEVTDSGGVPSFLSTIGETGSTAAMFLLLKHPITAFGGLLISNILTKSIESYKDNQKKEMIEDIRRNTENTLIKLTKDAYNEIQAEIERSITGYVDKFCDDHEHARDLMIRINILKSSCEELDEDLMLEKMKITSLG